MNALDLPERSGIELIGELARRGLQVPVLFVSAFVRAYGAQIPRHADVEVHEKPVPLNQLRELVRRRLAKPAAAAAAEGSPFSVAEYVQLACLGRHSIQLVVSRGGVHLGKIVVHGGELWSAEDALGVGEEACLRLASAQGARAEPQTVRDLGPRTVMRPWMALLLDATRAQDERGAAPQAPAPPPGPPAAPSRRASDPPPRDDRASEGEDAPLLQVLAELEDERERAAPPAARPPAARPRAAGGASEREERDETDALVARGVEALLERDYAAARTAFESAALRRPDDAFVKANLRRLAEREGASPAAPVAPAAPAAPARPVAEPETPTATRSAYDVYMEQGVEALLERRYPEALAAFEAALQERPGDPKARANVERLGQLGVTHAP